MSARPESPRSEVSSRSQDLPVNFTGESDIRRQKLDQSDSVSYTSEMSDSSAHKLINFKGQTLQDDKRSDPSDLVSCTSEMSDSSAHKRIDFTGLKLQDDEGFDQSDSVSCISERSDSSARKRIDFTGQILQDDKSFTDSGLESMNLPYDQPPTSLFSSQEPCQSPRWAEPGDVACNLCEGLKLKAYKSCLTCLASFCEKHAVDHYTKPALQRHLLVEVTKNLNILQENAQLKKMISELRKQNETLKRKIENLMTTNCKLRLPDSICKGKTPVAANLTLDADTAHRALVLTDDGKRVLLGEKKEVQDSSQRFDKWECVLATEGFGSGRHYWEVEVKGGFTIGVTRQSAQRRGKFFFSPSEGYWCLFHFQQAFTALDVSNTRLEKDIIPQVLGVCIDVDEKWVTFYNSQTKAHIYTFNNMNFRAGEMIYPVLSTSDKSGSLQIKTLR